METAECMRAEGEKLVYIVADGMGGHQRGEIASRTVLNIFRGKKGRVDKDQITDVMRLAKESLNRIAESDGQSLGLGTTISGLSLSCGKAFFFNCGDSRVYRLVDRKIEKITRDDSLVQELVDAGVITEDEMRTNPQKNIVTSAVTGDLRNGPPFFSTGEMKVKEGERFLVCTDGVWESMSQSDMEGCLVRKDLKEAVNRLAERTMESGARDNFSIIALEIG
jgi:protein phosphatase